MGEDREEGSRIICTTTYCSLPWAESRGWLRAALSHPTALSNLKVGHHYITYHLFPSYVLYYCFTVFEGRVVVEFYCGWRNSLDEGHENSQKVIKHYC